MTDNDAPRTLVFLLGGDGSGVCVCTQLLAMLGVPAASGERHPDGEDGEQRQPDIVALHERLLGLFDRGRESAGRDLLLPSAWWMDPRIAPVKKELAAILERHAAGRMFAVGEASTGRLLPLWQQLAQELNCTTKIVLCLRNPGEAVAALRQRLGIEADLSEYRWLNNMIETFRNLQRQQPCLIEYQDWLARPEDNLAKLMGFLDLRWYQSDADMRTTITGLLEPHRQPADIPPLHPLLNSVYELAGSFTDDAACRERTGQLVNSFITYQQLQQPLLRALQDIGRQAAAKVPQMEQALSGCTALIEELRGELDGLQSELESARDAVSRAEQRTADELAAAARQHEEEIARLRADLEAQERIAREANAGAAENSPQAREPTAVVADSRADDRQRLAEQEVAEFALARLKEDADRAKQAAAEANLRADELSRQLQQRSAERAATDAALARAQQDAQLQRTAVQRLQQELDALRGKTTAAPSTTAPCGAGPGTSP